MSSQITDFSNDDLPLLVEVISMNDSLLATAHAVKLVEARASYPINALSDLKPHFDALAGPTGSVDVGPCKVNYDQAAKYMPSQGFPITSRTELASRVLLAFESERGEMLSSIEKRQAALKRKPPR